MKRQRLNNIDIEEAYGEWEIYSGTGSEEERSGEEVRSNEEVRSDEEVRSNEEEDVSDSVFEQMFDSEQWASR